MNKTLITLIGGAGYVNPHFVRGLLDVGSRI